MATLVVSPAEQRAQALAAAPTAVSVTGVSKSFVLPHQQYHTLKERALHPFRSSSYDLLHAVRDVSFDVAEGEFLGIVGRNGSGKSTLLKCLAGIYDVDQGTVDVRGRLSPFIELGVGFNPDLTARDNVIINAIMLGLTRGQAQERFDEIIAFAELEEFLDLKLKNYSSGMSVRLAFSIAIQVDADITLVDEVLAVGDASFQQKCFEQFLRMKREGRTILFVTHDMGSVEQFCDRAVLMERGRVVAVDEPATIARKYNELNFGKTLHQAPDNDEMGRHPHQRAAEIVAAWFEDADGAQVNTLGQGDACRICFDVTFHEALENPIFAFTLRNEARHTVFVGSTHFDTPHTGSFLPGQTAAVRVEFETLLSPTRYTLTPSLAREGTGAAGIDVREDLATLLIHGRATGGIIELPHRFQITQE